MTYTARRFARHVLRGHRFNLGFCSICERRTLFVEEGPWLRDQYRCLRCDSIPRWRALIHVLEREFPDWRERRILECGPGGPASAKLAAECVSYVGSHFYLGEPLGSWKDGHRNENLAAMTFADEEFDLVITQDVFEHVLTPAKGFAEVARVLRPGGAHVFTVPYYRGRPSVVRAVANDDGVKHLLEPDYHANPVDPEGSLVVTEWGDDLVDTVYRASGLTTTINLWRDRPLGLEAEHLEIFVSRKPEVRP